MQPAEHATYEAIGRASLGAPATANGSISGVLALPLWAAPEGGGAGAES